MLLACQNISKAFGTKEVLKDINFHVNEKEKMSFFSVLALTIRICALSNTQPYLQNLSTRYVQLARLTM